MALGKGFCAQEFGHAQLDAVRLTPEGFSVVASLRGVRSGRAAAAAAGWRCGRAKGARHEYFLEKSVRIVKIDYE